jgi:uncharacterized membrane protein YqjE
MADSQYTQGPGKSVFGIGQRIMTLLVEMVETRLRLVVVELEEEKANLFQLFLMLGLTLLFAAFGLMSLLVLDYLGHRPQYRLYVMIATTAVLLLSALIGGIWTLRKARRSTFLRLTRKSWRNDRALLEEERHEQQTAARAKALLLRQIQQQRLDLIASRRDWLDATAPFDRGWKPSSTCVPGRWSAAV